MSGAVATWLPSTPGCLPLASRISCLPGKPHRFPPALAYRQVALSGIHWQVHGQSSLEISDTHQRSSHQSPQAVHSVTWPKDSSTREAKELSPALWTSPEQSPVPSSVPPIPADPITFLGTHTRPRGRGQILWRGPYSA